MKRLSGTVQLSRFVDDIRDRIAAHSTGDLRLIAKRCGKLTEANCRWQEYGLGPALLGMIECELIRRRSRGLAPRRGRVGPGGKP